MKRWLAKIVVFLLLGAVVNVAVAWGCALWSSQESYLTEEEIDVPQAWPSYLEELGWPTPASAIRLRGLGWGFGSVGVTVIEVSGGDPDASWMRSGPGTNKTFVSLTVRRFGLPFRALQWETHGVRAGPRGMELVRAAASAAGLRSGIDVSEQVGASTEGHMRSLPLTPLWPGFAINTIFCAAILRLLTLGPSTARRMIRRKRGHCIKCGYDLSHAAHEVCPECGAGAKPATA